MQPQDVFQELRSVSLHLWHGFGEIQVRNLLCFFSRHLFRCLQATSLLCLSAQIITVINIAKQIWTRVCNSYTLSSGPLPSKNCIKHKHFVLVAIKLEKFVLHDWELKARSCWLVPRWGGGGPDPCAPIFSPVWKHPVMPSLSIIFLQI